jgi:hypothetical protein
VRRKISAHVDGGLSGGSRVRRPGSEDPHRRERNSIMTQIGQIRQHNPQDDQLLQQNQ